MNHFLIRIMMLIILSISILSCSKNDSAPQTEPATVEKKQESADVQDLKDFIGTRFQSIFRNDTCENAKDPAVALKYAPSPVLVAAYVANHSECSNCIVHKIIRMYFTDTELRYIEIHTATNASEKIVFTNPPKFYHHREDGQSCDPILAGYSPYMVSKSFFPKWAINNGELVIYANEKIKIQRNGDELIVSTKSVDESQAIYKADARFYPMKAFLPNYSDKPGNMPYCDKIIYCDKP